MYLLGSMCCIWTDNELARSWASGFVVLFEEGEGVSPHTGSPYPYLVLEDSRGNIVRKV